MGEFVIQAPPGDGISCINFSPRQSNELLVSSWDCTTRIYDVETNLAKMTHYFDGACLASCFNADGTAAFSGGLDQTVCMLDFERGSKMSIGGHDKAISCMDFVSSANALVSGSWDKCMSVWDARNNARSHLIEMPGKIFSLSSSENRIVIATVDRHIAIYDIRNLSAPEQIRESPLKHQTRKVSCSPDGHSFAVGSTEGRLAVEYFDLDPTVQSKKYAFKCHRRGELAFPVNAICYNQHFGTFATGGCDGVVNIWDGNNKKRLCQLGPYQTSIASLAFSSDCRYLAIASSYTFEEGDKPERPDDNIWIHTISESEVKPRAKTSN